MKRMKKEDHWKNDDDGCDSDAKVLQTYAYTCPVFEVQGQIMKRRIKNPKIITQIMGCS